MSYKCLVVDDEELARELIERHLSQLLQFEVVASCASALAARRILQEVQVDLIFLDIEMPVLKGTDFFKNLIQKPKVIFTTAYRDYAIDGFELNAVDYLLKPITFERFFNATEKFLDLQQPTVLTSSPPSIPAKEQFLFIRKDRKQVKLNFSEVLYIESLKDYIKIHLEEDTHTIKHSLTGFVELLDRRFLRVHRSFVVNLDKITAYTKHDMEIKEIEIPIGDSYRNIVDDHFNA